MSLTEFNEKVFIAGIRAEGYAEGYAESYAEGFMEVYDGNHPEALQKAIQVVISKYIGAGKDNNTIISRITEPFRLTKEEAEEYFDKFSK